MTLGNIIAAARRRPVVAVSLVLAVTLGITNTFLWRQRGDITQQNEIMRKKGASILEALMARQHVAADLAKLQGALEMIDRNVVVEEDMELNLGYFYKLEKRTKVRLRQLSQLSAPPPTEGRPFRTVPVSLRASGTYGQLMTFLRQIETGPRIVTVRAFCFSRDDPASKLLSLDLTIDMLARP